MVTISIAGRQRALQFRQLRLDALDGAQRVLAGAHHHHAARHLALAVQLDHAAPRLGADLDACHVAEQQRRAGRVGAQHHLAEIVERAQIARGMHHVFRLGHLHHRAARLAVGPRQRVGHHRLRDAVGAHPVRVQHHLVLAHHAAQARHLRHIGHGLQLEAQEPVVERAQLPEIVPAAAVDQRVFVDPAHPGRVGAKRDCRAGRQAALYLVERLEHARARPVGIGLVVEQHVDEGVAERGIGADRLRPRHAEQGGGERVGDLVLDQLRRLAGIGDLDDDLRVGQVRQRVERRLAQRLQAPGRQQQRGQQHQQAMADRPADQVRDHCGPPLGSTALRR